jgi:hemerythrin superfamily protein
MPTTRTSTRRTTRTSDGHARTASRSRNGILSLLKQEHTEVKDLFEQYEKAAEKDPRAGSETVGKVISELMRHAEMEEQIVYPALKREDSEVYYEAHEEHHVAELLMGELQKMRPGDEYRAKMTVLAENVRHHIKEEESEAFKQLRKLDKSQLDELGERWQAEKTEWKSGMRKPAMTGSLGRG